ncbi:MAG: cell division protein FtsZ [bacterium]|nr:cell division protein FtsZ [bacterium]
MEIKPEIETFAKIKVVGAGGSGNAALQRMIQNNIKGVEFIAVNTDAQALHHTDAQTKIHIGKTLTRGLGAGMDPSVGKAAAEESIEEIHEAVKGADMVFVSCGLGGGTGTGAAPVIAQAARDAGALTVAVITKPFDFEGAQRKAIAQSGLEELQEKVDTMIVVPNDRIFQVIDKKTTLLEAFSIVDEVLFQGVQSISDLITVPGLVNVDFADVRAVMRDAGSALMGMGRASGEERAAQAAKQAVDSPLLELSINGAKGILFNVTAGEDLGMVEIDEAAKIITESVDPNAKVIFGAVIDPDMGDEMKVTVIATGFEGGGRPVSMSRGFMVPHSARKESAAARPAEPARPSAPIFGMPFKTQEVARVAATPSHSSESESANENELDIPAFIRKKMKK